MHAVQSAVRCASAHCVAARDRAIGVGIDVGDDDQVEVAIPVEVGEASGGAPARGVNAGPFSYVLESAVASIAVEQRASDIKHV